MDGKSAPGRSRSTSTSEPFARSPTWVGSVIRAGEVVAGAPDVEHQCGERCRPGGIDDPEPAPDDILGRERRPVREGQARAKVEDDAGPVLRDVPRGGEGGLEGEAAIECREALVELGGHRGRADVAGGGRVERGRSSREDVDVVRAAPAAGA